MPIHPPPNINHLEVDFLTKELNNCEGKKQMAEKKEPTKKKIGTQQIQTDHRIEEDLPKVYKCPVCSASVKQVVDKRGIFWKCKNEKCRWDSARPFDWNKDSRKKYVLECAKTLKYLFQQFNFVTNFPYSPDMAFTGHLRKGRTQYDISAIFFGNKCQKIRVELNQNLTKKQFYDSDFCYVIGMPETVEYMAKIKGLVCHYLADEKKEKILVSRMDKVVKHCPMEIDNFGNNQYFIPKEIRPLIVVSDLSEIKEMLFANLHKIIYKEIEIF